MARTLVITGGTNGIGLVLARHHSERGDQVIAIGSSPSGGDRLRREAPEARFVQADLSSVKQTNELTDHLLSAHPAIDALVLAAFRYHPSRTETGEGFERTFALYVVNRWLMSRALRPALENAPAPMILDLCGVGGVKASKIHWDDLQLERGYRPFKATMQGARAAELLATAYAADPVRYVLYNPLFVATGLSEPFRQPVRGLVKLASALFAQPVSKAVRPMTALIDNPPAAPLSAYVRGKPTTLTTDPAAARRLDAAIRDLVSPFTA
ncbi:MULTISPECIES: SDR family NAD(P)-dependent oxidoreductase [Nonomuraea]|uniref:SDR family NAD(P)-dependent oxidoreductase n=1 Tax=Nonomuraea ferruginea TaxID=46174 RepID=A0ABT4T4L1_9ACTN|nr:SDR family NAD(P)-dependent oxidoreductase [Nonomuraea ferruginea]MDA0644280.1 SDR family NAD(P)-dependent oxidoreductase [Nonomuraea ferruginea]